MHLHDRLDARIGALDLRDDSEYARFLTVQRLAREPMEAFLAERPLNGIAHPPLQTPLIEADLDALDPQPARRTSAPCRFEPSIDKDSQGAVLGVIWVLAGSAMGNSMMMRQLRRTPAATERPYRFLSDRAMPAYWQDVRPILEEPASLTRRNAATEAAEAVFAYFLSVADDCDRVSVAA